MRQLARIITHRAHKPIRRRLPHRVQQPTTNVQEYSPEVFVVEDVDFVERGGLDTLAGVVSMESGQSLKGC